MMDFVAVALKTFPNYRKFCSDNVEYQALEPDFCDDGRLAVVGFSDFDQVINIQSYEAPLMLGRIADIDTNKLQPLKRCLSKREKHNLEDHEHSTDSVLANLETDCSWFEELCNRFVEATLINGCSENPDHEYWEQLEDFIAMSQLTFWKLTVGVAEAKIYGLHEFMNRCDWAVKLAAQVFNSYLGMASRYEVVVETYLRAGDLFFLERVRCSLVAERMRLTALRKSLTVLRNTSKDLVNDLEVAHLNYDTKSQVCVAAVSVVLLEFDRFFDNMILKSYPNRSPQKLEEICGKTDYLDACGQYHTDYLLDASIRMTCNVNDICRGIRVLDAMDSSMEAALNELSGCIWVEPKLVGW